jgi:hypothetical protein
MPDKPPKRHGWTNLPGLPPTETMALVERIRKFRGRKTIAQILVELGVPHTRETWLRILELCRRFEVQTADPDDPDYFRKAIVSDRTQQDRVRAMAYARALLAQEIRLARTEAPTAPLYRGGP